MKQYPQLSNLMAMVKELLTSDYLEEINLGDIFVNHIDAMRLPDSTDIVIMVHFSNRTNLKLTLDFITVQKGAGACVDSVCDQMKDLEWKLRDQHASKVIDEIINEDV